MRPISSGLLAIATVAVIAIGGCGDDAADQSPSNVPGVSSNGGDMSGDSDVSGTSLPAISDPQMTPAPNPNAGAGSGDAGTGSAP
jgi:hypothetical protein